MEGLVILGIVAGLFVLLARSIRERACAGNPQARRWSGRRDREPGMHDGNFEEILEESRPSRL